MDKESSLSGIKLVRMIYLTDVTQAVLAQNKTPYFLIPRPMLLVLNVYTKT